jgi:protocatechuate 3,4-dioxygenase beta subunit
MLLESKRTSHKLGRAKPGDRARHSRVFDPLAAGGHRLTYPPELMSRPVPQDSVNGLEVLSPRLGITPQQMEGPYFLEAPERSDITEGRPGALLLLTLFVLDRTGVAYPPGIKVDLWAADASGSYSAFVQNSGSRVVDTRGRSFMRGCQFTDKTGTVTFRTIVPGWYSGRATHMHVMVRERGRRLLTTQLYFTDDLLETVSSLDVYRDRGFPDTHNTKDMVVSRNVDDLSLLTLITDKDASGTLRATHSLMIDGVACPRPN